MDKRSVGLLLILLLPSALANGDSFWQKYDWYMIGAGLILLVYILFKLAKKLVVLGLLIAVAVIVGRVFLDSGVGTTEIGIVGDVHHHADFALYLDGEKYDFSQA